MATFWVGFFIISPSTVKLVYPDLRLFLFDSRRGNALVENKSYILMLMMGTFQVDVPASVTLDQGERTVHRDTIYTLPPLHQSSVSCVIYNRIPAVLRVDMSYFSELQPRRGPKCV